MSEALLPRFIEEVRYVSLASVSLNPRQPRRSFDEEALEELARSIQSVGLLHPPLVRPLGDGCHELISGERRLRACEKLGMQKIPVVIRIAAGELSAEAALVENVQRVDLNPMEIAEALQRLAEEFYYSQEDLAEKVGKKRSTVANYLRLLSLPQVVRQAIVGGKLSMGHAKAILSVETKEAQERLYRQIVDRALSVREAESLASGRKVFVPSQGKTKRRNVHLEAVETKLSELLGTRVTISGSADRGQIRLDYYDLDDLNALLERLGMGL